MSVEILKTTHEGILKIGDKQLEVAVLENGQRIIKQASVFKALDRPPRGNARVIGIPVFMDAKNLQPHIDADLKAVINKVDYIDLKGKKQQGFDANILPLVSELYLKARDAGDITQSNQLTTAKQAEILMRALARVGITALVDEATGYQDVRMKDALNELLNKILLEEAKKYIVTYPLELYKQWFRLNNWEWKPENAQKKPGIIGKWTNELIYDRLAPGLLKELRRKNPKNEKGYRDHKHFQFLTDEIGEPRLREFFGGLIALARASTNWRKYYSMVNRAYPPFDKTIEMDFPDTDD